MCFHFKQDCSVHHNTRGSLLKFIPSGTVDEREREDRMDRPEGGEGGRHGKRKGEEGEKCLRMPAGPSPPTPRDPRGRRAFLLRSQSARSEAEITRVCLNLQTRGKRGRVGEREREQS